MSDPLTRLETVRRTGITLAIAAAGGLSAQALNLPAGAITGSAICVAAASVFGVKVMLPDRVRDVAFVMTGVSMGTSVARNSLSLIVQWPVTMVALALELLLIITLTGWMLRKLFRLDRGTAYMSSFPGHLSFVMSFAAAGVGDARRIVIIQVIRILLLTITVPIGAMFLPIDHFPPLVGQQVMQWPVLLALILGCAVVGLLFTRLRVPAAYVLGAMFAATATKLLGWYEGTMPPLLLLATFVTVGALIGSRLGGISRSELKQAAIGGLIATAMTIAITTIIAWGASRLVDMPFGQIWLGLSPGALEGMGALGLALGYDPAFIAAHHVTRLLLLTFAIPLVVFLIRGRDPKPAEPLVKP